MKQLQIEHLLYLPFKYSQDSQIAILSSVDIFSIFHNMK